MNKPRVSQLQASTTAGDVLTTQSVSGTLTAVWQAPSLGTPLFSDSDASPVVADDASDYLYQG